MSVRKFRKKPVVVEAIQWTGENLREVIDFTGKHPKWAEWFASWEEYEARVRADGGIFKIITLEGTMEAKPGDWIIRGVKGEHYPCKGTIFAQTYDHVNTLGGVCPENECLSSPVEERHSYSQDELVSAAYTFAHREPVEPFGFFAKLGLVTDFVNRLWNRTIDP